MELKEAYYGRTTIIMKIVASVPNVKIIYLPGENNIHEYGRRRDRKNILNGITYAKSEAIMIAAKGYKEKDKYREFLGTIIHEMCHFAISETFGNDFEPYYQGDKDAASMWQQLVTKCIEIQQDKEKALQIFSDLFSYSKECWISELVVRIPEVYVVLHDKNENIAKFEDDFKDIHRAYVDHVHEQFNLEAKNIAALRSVNERSLLANDSSKLCDGSLKTLVEVNLEAGRQVIKTNQTYLALINIYQSVQELYFNSKFMFIDIGFIESDKNMEYENHNFDRRWSF